MRIHFFESYVIYYLTLRFSECSMEFTLPALTQESFSRWYNKALPRQDGVDERIVYPGLKLTCSTKSRDLRSNIQPRHVFVTREIGTDKYHHKVLGSNNVFISLPKRLYSHCFRNINIHSIPTGNRITVRLTETTTVVLPFIPDDFVNQKRSKRNSLARTKSKRENKRARITEDPVTSRSYTGWVTKVLSPATELAADNGIDSFQLLKYIRTELKKSEHELSTFIPNPMADAPTIEDIKNNPEKLCALTTIIQFVHHYANHII